MILQTPPPQPIIPFDPNQLIPLIGMIGGMVVAGVVLYAFFKSDLAKAMAERIRAGMHRKKRWKGFGGSGPTHLPRVSRMRITLPSWSSA